MTPLDDRDIGAHSQPGSDRETGDRRETGVHRQSGDHRGSRIHCEETLPVGDPTRTLAEVLLEDVENAPSRAALPEPSIDVAFRPVVDVEAVTRATFETSVGVIHRIDSRDHLVVEAGRDGPRLAPDGTVDLVGVETVPLAEERARFDGEVTSFEGTVADHRAWAVEQLCDALETTVTYTGPDDVSYDADCRPSPEDVDVVGFEPLYVPRVDVAVELGGYVHRYRYDAAGGRHRPHVDEVRRCVHCESEDGRGSYTYCDNCGSISCETHAKTERLTGEPICTGCAVTADFAYATAYFADEEHLETFRDAYEAMPVHRKAMENPQLVAAFGAVILLVVVGLAAVIL